jgi:hypothetical protein
MEIIPDLTTVKNQALINLTKSNWDELGENMSKFLP